MYGLGAAVFVHLLAPAFFRQQPGEDSVTVKIKQGTLQGQVVTSLVAGHKYYSFLGIPYAKPPLGALRFKGPREPEPWTGVRDATTEGSACVQRGAGAEDCLFLNVMTPEVPGRSGSIQLKPVMVWIHGGAYQWGSASPSNYTPDYLLSRQVVFVSFNYRLGVLGFLSVEGSDAAGNAGLKDQVAALRWVQTNIGRFGGDAGCVTVFGNSAGASSVHHHILSPMSAGLFHRAISQSGAAVNPTAFCRSTRDRAFRLGRLLGLHTTSAQQLVDSLRGVAADRLVALQDAALTQEESEKPLAAAFIPTTEHLVEGEQVFLQSSPRELMRNGHFQRIPYITGVNKEEGIIALMECGDAACLRLVDQDFERVLPLNLGLQKGSEDSKSTAEQVRQLYFKDSNVSQLTSHNYVQMQGDVMYAYGWRYVVSNYAQYNQHVYSYKLEYREATARGVSHGDELKCLFYKRRDAELQDMKVVDYFISMWTNFAKTGNPSVNGQVTWKAATQEHLYYLSIDAQLSLHDDTNNKRLMFWDDVYTSLGLENTYQTKLTI